MVRQLARPPLVGDESNGHFDDRDRCGFLSRPRITDMTETRTKITHVLNFQEEKSNGKPSRTTGRIKEIV